MDALLASGRLVAPARLASPAARRLPLRRPCAVAVAGGSTFAPVGSASTSSRTVGEIMTRRDSLRVVKPSTSVETALQMLVEDRISGFPVIDNSGRLVGVVSDYDLLALDSISGTRISNDCLFPDVNSSWESFFEIQSLLDKNHGKIVSDVMTSTPLVLHESTNLDEAARLLLTSKYHRLPVVDASGKLVGVINRGSLMRAAVEKLRDNQMNN